MTSSGSRRVQPHLQERRRNRRLIVTPLVYLKGLPHNGGLLLDLSESGICVSLANPLVMSEKFHFSFSLVEPQLIEGVGRICWISESGRKAGIQFVECSDFSHEQIAAWLGHEGMSQEEIGPLVRLEESKELEAQTGHSARGTDAVDGHTGEEVRSRYSDGREGHSEQMSSNRRRDVAESPPDLDLRTPEADASYLQEAPPSIQDTPLFFLPQKKTEHEDVSPDSSGKATERDCAQKQGEKPGYDSDVPRSTLAAGLAERENEARKKSAFGRAAGRTALLLVLILLGFTVYRYQDPLLVLERYVLSANKVINPTPAKKVRGRHVIPRSIQRIRDSGEVRRFGRSGSVYTFRAPGMRGGGFSVQGLFPGLRSPSVPGTDVGPSTSKPENAGPQGSSKSFSGVQFIGLMATLHDDGALVEEGTFPSSSSKQSKPTSVWEQIVLDVMVGKNGEVKDVRLISSPDSKLAKAVISSVRRWTYRPLYESGRAVEFTTRITLNVSKSSRLPRSSLRRRFSGTGHMKNRN